MTHINAMTQYFTQSLIDADRLCPNDKELLPALGLSKSSKKSDTYIALDKQCWLGGYLDAELAQRLIRAKQGVDKNPLTEIEVLMFPRVDLYRYDGGQGSGYKRRVLLPLVVFARLQLSGQLLPADKSPWIPRIWLAPNESRDEPIGEYDCVDEFLTLNPFEGIESWPKLVQYSTELLAHIVGESNNLVSKDGSENQNNLVEDHRSIFDLDINSEYQMSSQCLLQAEAPVTGAKAKLLDVLTAIKDDQPSVPLYERYCDVDSPALKKHSNLQHVSTDVLAHVGQMSGEFPLSEKQRNALHYFNRQQDGEILAVNGPPGTGKTTLLRSVVANLWTQAAIDEGEPPLIVAASNNNQAVTNILESFAKVDEEGLEQTLKGRWLPEVSSYGLYCCAKSKASGKYPYHLSSGEGCMEGWQTLEYVETAKPKFLEKAAYWAKDAVDSVGDARKMLHEAMQDTTKKIKQGFAVLKTYQNNYKKLHASYASVDELQSSITATARQLKTLIEQLRGNKLHLDHIYVLWERRKWWVQLLWWISFIRKTEIRKTSRLLSQWDILIQSHDDDVVEHYFLDKEKEFLSEIASTEKRYTSMVAILDAYQKSELNLVEWIEINKLESLLLDTYSDSVHEICDRTLRFRLFKLATHYWEARWLLETEEFVSSRDEDKKSPVKVLRKLRRYAKLMPCFVSTFYMVPAIFVAGKYTDSVWKDLPLFNEIDLLIIDESGQASPEVSSVSFSLAKKALVVGDTDQIEPVWAVPASVDRANLRLFGLLKDESDYEHWLRSGLLASSGNAMRVAQRQTYYHQFSQLQRGLYLTEHRRCYNSIIDYCNELVYEGVLESKRGDPAQVVPWGCMSFVAVEGVSDSAGGSRSNINEAKAIALWLQQEKNNLINYIDSVEPTNNHESNITKLEKSVGIITPFKKQTALIRAELKKIGITGLTVGTVHSLQGDERLVVLFSAVYGSNDKVASKFYDRSRSMLNVAVSRAKDSFIVFGHDDVFGIGSANLPSRILRKRLSNLNVVMELAHDQ
jgi:hypothetical protein